MPVFSPSDVAHPFDESARRRLESMRGLPAMVQAFMEVYPEREDAQPSGCVRLGPDLRPEIYRMLPPVCEAFGIPEPDLYLAPGDVNAYTFGLTRTSIVVFSGLLDLMAPDEIQAVIAHECGHILLRHVLYHSMVRVPGGAREYDAELRSALTAWFHKSELSADRAAAAYLGGADAITRVLFRFAGMTVDVPYVHSVQSGGKRLQWMAGGESTHPMLAVRVREIQAWAATPGFARLVVPSWSE